MLKDKTISALILAGGLGTRLRGVLPDLPKPMAPVGERPFLEYLISQIKSFGIENFVFCVGYKAEVIENHFGDGARFGVHIEYSREDELLGTAGALKLAQTKIKSDNFLLFNGDCFCEFDGKEFLKFHREKNAVATILATRVEDRARFGSLEIDGDKRVLGFHEKGADSGSAKKSGLINAGIYVLNQRALDLIPISEKHSLEQQVFPALCGNGLFAFPTLGEFIDIGIPKEWQRAQELLPSKIKL